MIYVSYYIVISFLFWYAKDNKRLLKQATVASAAMLVLIVALRHSTMGVDLIGRLGTGYINSFYEIGQIDWGSIFRIKTFLNYEFAYVLLNKLLYTIFPHHQFLIIVCAILSIVPVFILINKYSENPYLSIVLYLALPIFLLTYSGLRQAIAISFCCVASCYIEEKKLFRFAAYVAIASLFHSSALLFLLAYPIFRIKIKPQTRLLFVLFLPVTYLFRNQVFAILCRILNVSRTVSENGAFLYFLFLSMNYILLLLFGNEKQNGWMNLFFVACLIQSMAGVDTMVLRVDYYYLISLPIVIPNVTAEISNQKNKFWVTVGVFFMFLVYGFYAIFNNSWAEAYPYHFFWETL